MASFISDFATGWKEAAEEARTKAIKPRGAYPEAVFKPKHVLDPTDRVAPARHLSALSLQDQFALAGTVTPSAGWQAAAAIPKTVAIDISERTVTANDGWQRARALLNGAEVDVRLGTEAEWAERIATTINGVEVDGRPSLIQQCSLLAFIVKLPSSTPLLETVAAAEKHLGIDPSGKSLVERAAACYDKVYTPNHEYVYSSSSKPHPLKPLEVEVPEPEPEPVPIDLSDRPTPTGAGGNSMLVTYRPRGDAERGTAHILTSVRGPRKVITMGSPKRKPSQCGFDDIAVIAASRMGQVGDLDLRARPRVVC